MLQWTGERFLPGVEGDIVVEHLHRYHAVGELVDGLQVLDVACGEGYGSTILARRAASVIGVDISVEAVAHATATVPARQPALRRRIVRADSAARRIGRRDRQLRDDRARRRTGADAAGVRARAASGRLGVHLQPGQARVLGPARLQERVSRPRALCRRVPRPAAALVRQRRDVRTAGPARVDAGARSGAPRRASSATAAKATAPCVVWACCGRFI